LKEFIAFSNLLHVLPVSADVLLLFNCPL